MKVKTRRPTAILKKKNNPKVFETIFGFSEFTSEFAFKILIYFFIIEKNPNPKPTLSGLKLLIAKVKNSSSYLHFCSVENETL